VSNPPSIGLSPQLQAGERNVLGVRNKEMWTCPDCGHRFVTKNMWHSCSNYTLEHHFAGCQPNVREIFDRYVEVIEACGPVEVIPQKTRIAIQADVRCAGAVIRKKGLLAKLWLTRRVAHPTLQRVEKYGPRSYGHQFRLDSVDDIDSTFRGLVGESYSVGLREHLRGRS
jgi:hypothetical protein